MVVDANVLADEKVVGDYVDVKLNVDDDVAEGVENDGDDNAVDDNVVDDNDAVEL